jgi:hypothetical protein
MLNRLAFANSLAVLTAALPGLEWQALGDCRPRGGAVSLSGSLVWFAGVSALDGVVAPYRADGGAGPPARTRASRTSPATNMRPTERIATRWTAAVP